MVAFTELAAAVAVLASTSLAKEMAVNMELKAELYDSGVRHEQIMAMKYVCENLNLNRYPNINGPS